MDARNVQYVILLQRHVWTRPVQNAFDVHRNHLFRQILTLTVEYSPRKERIAKQTVGLLHQLAHRIQRTAQLVNARMIKGTAHFQTVGETVQNGIHGHHIAVHGLERREVQLIHRRHRILPAVLTLHAHRLLIGIGHKSARIIQ